MLCEMLLKTLSALARLVPHPPSLVRLYNINAQERICSLVNRAKLVIFIRGTEARPECEDSKQLVELLLLHRARFEVVNVLTDYNAEMGIKEYTGDSRTQWNLMAQTLPQRKLELSIIFDPIHRLSSNMTQNDRVPNAKSMHA